jgi:chemotaxis signal transduction protein
METATDTLAQNSLFNASASLEVITFYVGKTQYATPVSEVRYIEQDKRKTTRIELDKKVGAEVTSYQGKPVPIYDLANLMGCEAEYKANLDTLQVLKEAEKDHVSWVESLETCLRDGSKFTLAKDPNLCMFGKWLADFQADDEILADIFEDFDAPHKKIHSLASELLLLRDNDDVETALSIFAEERTKTFTKLISLFSAARDRLENITRPILLYIDTGKKMIAVRLNAISDIVTYSKTDYTTQAEVDDNSQLKNLNFFSGYLENKEVEFPPCVLLDWRLFSGNA